MNTTTKIVLAVLITAIMVGSTVTAYYEIYRKPALTGIARIKAKGTLVVGLDVYPPWASQMQNGSWEGFDIDVMKKVAEKIGVQFEGKAVVWETIVPALMAKDIDVIASALSITPDRSEQVLYSIAYYEVTLSFVVKADKVAEYKSTDDFIGKKVGAQAGTTGWDLAQTLYGNTSTEIRDFLSIPDLLLALDAGVVDTGIFDTPTARDYCKQEPAKFAVAFTHPTHGYPDYYAYAVRPEDGELAEVINTVIVELMESGEMAQLMAKWEVSP